jgi:1-acyl-sn-glycerol-3-phosphate acyltransferase
MGLGLSLFAAFQAARISAPTVVEALFGLAERSRHDRRLREFGKTVVDRARIRLEVIGAERVPPGRAYVYMSNHQSHVDIPVLYATVPSPTLRMVAKTELFRIPVFGRAMRAADFVEVDRGDRVQAVAALDRARALIASGVSVWIAPEGHRSATGELGPLKKGGFHLARATATPIVPVAIDGTFEILPPGERAMRTDRPVRVEFGAPVPVAERPVDELMADVGDFLRARVRRRSS